MKAPSFWHMVFASLVSAFAWVDSSINHAIKGSKYHKAYIFGQRDAILSDPVMIEGLAWTKNPPEGKSKYHQQKDMWTRFLEVGNGQRGDAKSGEEAVSKYFAFTAVIAGALIAFPIGLIIGVLT